MKTLHHILFLNLFVGVILLAGEKGAYCQQEKEVAKKELPAAVRAAFEKAYPNATIKGASSEKEHGKLLYEIESVDGSTLRDILYTPEGKVLEVEETVVVDSLPSVVLKAIHKQSSDGKIVKAEKVMRGKTLEYEIHIEKNNRMSELVIDTKGHVVKTKQMKEKKESEGTEND